MTAFHGHGLWERFNISMVAIATHRQTDCGDLGLFDETAAVLTETTIERFKRGTKIARHGSLVLASLRDSRIAFFHLIRLKGPQVPAADARSKSAYRSQSGLRTAQGPVSPSCPRKAWVHTKLGVALRIGPSLILYCIGNAAFRHVGYWRRKSIMSAMLII